MITINVNIHALICRFAAIFALSIVSMLCTVWAPEVSADVYRWVEADGTVNYGERAPKDREYTVVSRSAPSKAGSRIIDRTASGVTTPSAAPRTAGGNPLPDEANMSDRQKAMLSEIQAAEAARLAAVNKMRKSNCETSKRTLSNLQTRGRIRVRNDAGEETAMTDEDRAERIRQAQQSVLANCDSLS